jgi:spore protease
MSKRTDLAVELIEEGAEQIKGVRKKVHHKNASTATEVIIEDNAAASKIGKPIGRYITIETTRVSGDPSEFNEQVEDIAEEIIRVSDCGGKSVLVVGLGNDRITPDSLGPKVVSQVLVTRHLAAENVPKAIRDAVSVASVSAIAPGVLGQTGIEAAETIEAIARFIRPERIFVVDALACSDISRLGSTIQLTDTGISPGSGVQNRRKELSEESLGVPVTAIGVPTVIDMHTIAENLTGCSVQAGTAMTINHLPNMMVTPRDVDKLVERMSKLIAFGINKATQPYLTIEDITSLS